MPSVQGQTGHHQVITRWGGSDGRLQHGDICPLDEVLVLSVDQRVPLIKVSVQSCQSRDGQPCLRVAEAPGDVRWILLRWRCRKASVALLQRLMASSGSISPFSFISFPIQFPVRKVKSGKLWWTVPLAKGGKVRFIWITAAAGVCDTWWWSSSSGWRESPASSCDWCSPPTGTSPSWWKRPAVWPEERSHPLEGTSRRPTQRHTCTRSSTEMKKKQNKNKQIS